MAFYRKFLEIGSKIFHVIGVLSLSAIIVVVSWGVFVRKFLTPLPWTEEICALFFISLAFSGACVATYKRRHIVVDFLHQKFSKEMAKIIAIVSNLLIIAFMCLVCVGSFLLLPQIHMILTVNLDIPRSVFFSPLLVASIYIALFFIYDTIMILTKKNEEETAQPAGGNHS